MFTLSIETDAGTYVHGFHLGSHAPVARLIAQEIFLGQKPKIGSHIVTVALIRDRKIYDVFDGTWTSDA